MRDIYVVDDDHILIITTDRISAFDVILPTPIPGKGEALTAISNFWFNHINAIVPNHLVKMPLDSIVEDMALREMLASRCVVAQKLKPLPVEAIVRGYLIGSGWKDYQREGAVCGVELPNGLRLAERLPEPIFTPSTKAKVGEHDVNINLGQMANLVGRQTTKMIREISIAIYEQAAAYALEQGIIIADTKFEFGLNDNGQLVLIDEALTPDSSRFWPVETYSPGNNPTSFDKQFVRDYLESLAWDKTPPAPALPKAIVEKTAQKYQDAKQRLLAER